MYQPNQFYPTYPGIMYGAYYPIFPSLQSALYTSPLGYVDFQDTCASLLYQGNNGMENKVSASKVYYKKYVPKEKEKEKENRQFDHCVWAGCDKPLDPAFSMLVHCSKYVIIICTDII